MKSKHGALTLTIRERSVVSDQLEDVAVLQRDEQRLVVYRQ